VTRQYRQGGLTVPYITQWSGERQNKALLVKKTGREGGFLGYADEHPYDRDNHGALWVRYSLAQGKGHAKFNLVHPLRQRNAMIRSLCQVCRSSVLLTGHERELFVVKGMENRPITEGETTSAPPVCEGCAPIAVQDCPHLKTGSAAAWVDYSPVWGVAGTVYNLDTLLPVPGMDLVDVPYTSPLIKHVLARRTVVTLRGCTPVDVDTLRSTGRTSTRIS
jgi:hypothetical protein